MLQHNLLLFARYVNVRIDGGKDVMVGLGRLECRILKNQKSDIRYLAHVASILPVNCRRLLLMACCLLTLLAGCGGGSDYVKVSGKVTYEDGSLIPDQRIDVVFYPGDGIRPQDEAGKAKTNWRVGRGMVNIIDGTFDSVTSFRYGDGIMPGKHRVGVEAPGVPREYASAKTTPLVVDTKDSPFTLLVRKPGSKSSHP